MITAVGCEDGLAEHFTVKVNPPAPGGAREREAPLPLREQVRRGKDRGKEAASIDTDHQCPFICSARPSQGFCLEKFGTF